MAKPGRRARVAALRLQAARETSAAFSTAVALQAPAGVGGSAPRKPYSTVNRPRRTTKASGARGDYDTSRWKRESAAFLREHPICACGCGRPANVVDHVEPVRASGDPRFFDKRNWQALARYPCHLQKSADDRAKARGRKPQQIRTRVEVDPATGLPRPGQWHPWSEPAPEE